MTTHHRPTWSRAAGCLLLCTALAASLPALGARAATTDPDPSPREIANAALSRQAATEGMVLFENAGALPMAARGNVALFGYGAYATVKGGTGSGDVNNRTTVNVRQGFEKAGFTITTSAGYWDAMVAAKAEQALTTDTARPSESTKTAVFVLSRNSGEGRDRSATKGDYYLTDTESANLALLARTYRQVVVVLNVGAVVDTAFFDDMNDRILDPRGGQGLDALLLMSQPGQEAGNALVDVLTGAVTPSGKTVDSWASSYDYYPAAKTFSNNDGQFTPEVYSEGVYVGYRYFDSFYRKINRAKPGSVVDYPFGFGESYTTFDVKTTSVQADLQNVSVTVKVTNTGRAYAGNQVVQVYFSAPQDGLDKPYQELAGYAKTDLLRPGQSQQLKVSFATTEMASYDAAKSANVMDAGDYLIRVGDSSRTTAVAAKLRLDRRLVTEKLSAQLDAPTIKKELTSNPAQLLQQPR
ncbi:MAG: glycoside hydrolase family 3 C-terminal domain-containing protein [Micropruina sp.]|nr:glycoside hydrolase family 3 C-terminal domain-containing protein [Micropruina sp.]